VRAATGSVAMAVAAAVACSSTGTVIPQPPCIGAATTDCTHADPMQACQDMATAACRTLDGCSDFLVQLLYGSVESCEVTFSSQCTISLGAMGTGWTGDGMEACANAWATVECSAVDVRLNKVPFVCQPPPGMLAAGAACGDDSQCQTQYCQKDCVQQCGVCATRSDSNLCWQDDDCGNGRVCRTPGLLCAGTCVTPGGAGMTCDLLHPCASVLACKYGMCSLPNPAGAGCNDGTCDLLVS
jgi:hypothetical protein